MTQDLIIVMACLLLGGLAGWLLSALILRGRSVSLSKFQAVEAQLAGSQTTIALNRHDLSRYSADLEKLQLKLGEWEDRYAIVFTDKEFFRAAAESLRSRNDELVQKLQQAEIAVQAGEGEISALRASTASQQARLDAQREQLLAQKQSLEDMGISLKREFQLMAGSILEEKSKKFTETNSENLKNILEPLQKDLGEFKQTVKNAYDGEARERFSLGEKIKDLISLNQRISDEANNLTRALKGEIKKQGDWGEMILETILEHSGLVRNREYFVQEFIRDEAGNIIRNEEGQAMKPDIILHYPDKRSIVLDSKVSLLAYERFANSPTREDQEKALTAHILSIKSHIDGLSSKNYQHYIGSLDWVVLFVPIEPAYLVALHADAQLWNYAYRKRIILVCPSNLMAVLKITADLWKREYHDQNALEIARRGGQLYDKFVGFINTMQELGASIGKASAAYEKAFRQLNSGSGNLVRQAELLRQLEIKATKRLPESLVDKADD